MNASGKLVIVGILTIAFASAAASWWFRYTATHRAAEFWGPEAVLIRDAPSVELHQLDPSAKVTLPTSESAGTAGLLDTTEGRDISNARGLTHLRNALLEDRSYRWPPQPTTPSDRWKHVLIYRDDPRVAILVFSADWKFVSGFGHPSRTKLSSDPIAAGLAKMFDELAAEAAER